jgi:hypothetical protein
VACGVAFPLMELRRVFKMVVPMDGDGVSCRVPRGALVVTM